MNSHAKAGMHFDILPNEIRTLIESDQLSADDTERLMNLANPGSEALAELEGYERRHSGKTKS